MGNIIEQNINDRLNKKVFFELRDNIYKINTFMFLLMAMKHLMTDETIIKDYNDRLSFAVKQTQSVLDKFQDKF